MSGFEKNCRWHFAPFMGGQEQGPNEATSDTFKKQKYDSLVRESIQNSLDVPSSNDKPVVVSFIFRRIKSEWFPQLLAVRNHIDACATTWNDENAHKKFDPMVDYLDAATWDTLDFLEVRDENTKGMDYTKGDRKCGFYSFVKSVGNSSKSTKKAGGSHGFGKAAFPLISKFNTVLVSTLTRDNKYHFEGVCSLCNHELNGQNYVPVGYYCNNDNEEPVSNPNEIPPIFCRKTIGSSIFIMGLGQDDAERKDSMKLIRAAAIKHFWMAILQGKLIVRYGIDNRCNEINSGNLLQFAEKQFPEFEDKRGHKNPRPYIEAVVNAGTDDKHIVFNETIPVLGKVSFYMLKSKNGIDYILNMRDPMMLVDYENNRSQYGFYSVFICTDEDGNEILRMSENAQHNEWDSRNTKTKQDKHLVEEALEQREKFVQQCISSVFASSQTQELTFGGLDDFLTIPSSLDEDEDFNNEFGKPSGELTDDETSSENTELDDVNIRKPKSENLGTAQVKKKRKKKQIIDEEGDEQPTGHEPEVEPEDEPEDKPDEPDEPQPDTPEDEPEDNPEDKPDEPKEPEEEGEDTNSEPDEPMEEDEDYGKKSTRVKPLKVSYRTFAQTSDEGKVVHKLIVHSNRAAERVMIGIISGGESSDEKLAIQKTDNGNIAGNQLTNVTLLEGKTVITVWFADDMRHAIKLKVYEDK